MSLAAAPWVLGALGVLGLAAAAPVLQDGGAPDPVVEEAAARPPDVDRTGLREHVLERIDEARAAVLADPGSATAWGGLGELLFAHQLFDAAETSLREAHRLAPGTFRHLYVLALATDRNARQPEETIALLRAALELDPTYVAAWRNLGVTYQRDGWYDDARGCFERALELDPEFAGARLGLGQVDLSTGHVAAAVENLERVLAVAPDDRSVLAALAQAYQRAGDEARAREVGQRAVRQGYSLEDRDPILEEISELGSSTFDARVRAEKALAEGRWADAVRDLELFLEGRSGSVGVRYHLARALTQLGELRRAREELKLVLAATPEHLDAQLLDARILLQGVGKIGAARKHLAFVLERDPGNVEALVLSAVCEVERKDYEAALRLFDEVKRLQAASRVSAGAPPYRLTVQERIARGCALLGAGRLEEAVGELEDVVKQRPDVAEGHFRLGEAYEHQGRREEALACYEEAARRDGSLPVAQARRRLGR